MEEPHLEAGIGDGELIDWSGGDGSRWVSVFFFPSEYDLILSPLPTS